MKKINGYEIKVNNQVQELLNTYDESIYAPKKDEIFKALELTSLNDVKVVILGQDPYPIKGDAMGLSFSVNREEKLPKSLINMFKELENDLEITRTSGNLTTWAKQGVLLLNTILTVEIDHANSHKGIGWEECTNHIIKQVSNKGNVIFLLLGKQAEKYENLIASNNVIVKTSHPSPLGAYRGFTGSKIYSQINEKLVSLNKEEINW